MSSKDGAWRWWLGLGLVVAAGLVIAAVLLLSPDLERSESGDVDEKVADEIDMGDQILPWYIERLGYRSLWLHTKGAEVKIAVLDSGVARDVPGLETAKLSMLDEGGKELDFEDERDHGTPVVSLLLSKDDEAPGVAVHAEVVVYVVYDATGEPISHRVASAMKHALSDPRTDIILCSFGLSDQDDDVAVQVEAAAAAQVPVVVANGNEPEVRYTFPEDFPSVLIVGGSERDDRPLAGARSGEWTKVYAPGRDLVVRKGDHEVHQYEYGTSGAAAIVAGTLALGLSASMQWGEPLEGGRPAHRTAAVEALIDTAQDEWKPIPVISPVEFVRTLVPELEIEF